MKTRHDDQLEKDPTPSRVVVEKYRALFPTLDGQTYDLHLRLVTYRGGEEEFRLGREYCLSKDPLDLREWEREEEISALSIEAAETLGDPALLNRLQEFLKTKEFAEDKPLVRLQSGRASKACEGGESPGKQREKSPGSEEF